MQRGREEDKKMDGRKGEGTEWHRGDRSQKEWAGSVVHVTSCIVDCVFCILICLHMELY